ncbi:putative sugar ABC transporter substrate-binding protein [Microlunatus phosphovorus NM-1]|uniref:Putative sugar ABC transporter substrate-binding protein n=1 Tax=Microlunatus phosphovorus (strain ATCC 700054 / DSM 10555 / JCM 9379 / NBRC 101784 / NCIMB 13414 / VKM Ac-1990 / NM-1) TaxID=1032480 RepID=F5XQM3_MICPN|nr:extracellular solute-binding protein [Microlunatus phosphovorus]BAK34523.1 putative sugar ABC transporter substrate-binding protein [Microlunatus phosphovorus NM-1]
MSGAFDRSLTRRNILRGTALAGLAVGGGGLLSACGSGSSGTPGAENESAGTVGTGGTVTWASWANPGEAERFKQISKEYEAKYQTKVTWQLVVGDYMTKLLTQLAGGAAPDVFYVPDNGMAKLIESKTVVDLTEFVNKPDSPLKLSDTYESLMNWVKPLDGDGIYGLLPDCNPLVFWFNKDLVAEAGLSKTPAEHFEAGTWTRDAADEFLTKMKTTGKRGMVLEAGAFSPMSSWITSLGGTAFDEDNKAVFNEDPKALETLEWLWEGMAADKITFGGTLPKGQGIDALFYGQQLASCQMGRWILPNLRKLKFGYDIAPFPSADGKSFGPSLVAMAAVGVNSKAKDPEAAMWFATRFCNKDGQQARLSGGGNAVASVTGLDEIVTEGGPDHGSWFNDVAKAGYGIPLVIASKPAVSANLATEIDKSIKAGDSAKKFADKIAAYINSGG